MIFQNDASGSMHDVRVQNFRPPPAGPNRLQHAAHMLLLLLLLPAAHSINNGLARTPPMGWNSWMAVGWGITDAIVRETAAFLAASGLQSAGYSFLLSDDGWSAHRGPDGKIVPDPTRWPHGLNNVSAFLHANNFSFGLYTSESSVVCSGRPGSLFYEEVDAQSFAAWEIDFISALPAIGPFARTPPPRALSASPPPHTHLCQRWTTAPSTRWGTRATRRGRTRWAAAGAPL